MTLKIPTIEELIKLNGSINRRLRVAQSWKGNKFYLIDADDIEIKADMICLPWAVSYPSSPNAKDWRTFYPERPYHLQHEELGGYLTFYELKLALGKDCNFFDYYNKLQAMCAVASTGPGIANAYVIGCRYEGMGSLGYSITGVQWYRIKNKNYERLDITNSQLFESIKEDIKRERATK